MKRSLYQCFNARTKNKKLFCAIGHSLGAVTYLNLKRGSSLELRGCQSCLDYNEMGDPVAKEDRGWIK